MENNTVKILIEVPKDMNDVLLAYKRALKRLTGKNMNKDEIIVSILETRLPTLKAQLERLNAEYNLRIR